MGRVGPLPAQSLTQTQVVDMTSGWWVVQLQALSPRSRTIEKTTEYLLLRQRAWS